MILVLLLSCHSGDVCAHESVPSDVPVGALKLVANPGNVNLSNDAVAQTAGQEFVVTYTDQAGRTWQITYEIGDLFAWYHD